MIHINFKTLTVTNHGIDMAAEGEAPNTTLAELSQHIIDLENMSLLDERTSVALLAQVNMHARLDAFVKSEPDATAACVAILNGKTPHGHGFDRAMACGLADHNRWNGESLYQSGREVALHAQAVGADL